MNISFEKQDNMTALLTVTLEKTDYEKQVNDALKNFSKKANLPGFRAGHAPMAIIKKRFGTEIKAEEVNKVLGQEIYRYIKDQKLNILGQPLPNDEKTPAIDFETMDTLTFAFDVALAPEFDAKLTDQDKLTYYAINVDDAMVDKEIQGYCQRLGQYNKVDSYEAKDMVKGHMAELDVDGNVKEGGIEVENAVMLPDYMKNEDEKAKFNGAKVNDVMTFNPFTAYDGSDVELSSLLKITKEEAAEMKSDFRLQITEITRYEPSPLNQELFDRVLGEGAVSSEEEFRKHVADDIKERLKSESDAKFAYDLRKYIVGRVGEVQFPEDMLKRILKLNNPDKSDEDIEKNMKPSLDELLWRLAKEQLADQMDIKVEQDDVMETARRMTRIKFAQYGMTNLTDEVVDKFTAGVMKDKAQVEQLVSVTEETKIAAKAKEIVSMEEKSVSLEEFDKLFEEESK